MANSQGPATQALLAANVGGVLVAAGSGTTSATINTASLVTHAARNAEGSDYPAASLRLLAIPTSNAGGVYRSAAPTATQIDVRSAVASVPYDWFLFLVN